MYTLNCSILQLASKYGGTKYVKGKMNDMQNG
jgi:hypothetical protein